MRKTGHDGGHEQGRAKQKGGGAQDSHQNARAGETDKAVRPGEHAGWTNEEKTRK